MQDRAVSKGKGTNMKLVVATFLFFFKAAVPDSLGAGLKDKTSVQKSEFAGICNSYSGCLRPFLKESYPMVV